jgi:peptidoglycan-associated lipoprotein
MNDGALKGRSLLMVGHADPRGEEDYNMALGGRRAESVRGAMESLGVDKGRMDVSSRGELEATGVDEESWAKDRRVDIKLKAN